MPELQDASTSIPLPSLRGPVRKDRYEVVIDPVNCDGHWIAAGKRQFERLVEKRVNPMVFLPFRVGARGLRV